MWTRALVWHVAQAQLIRNHRSISPRPIELLSSTVMFGRISAVFVLVSIVTFFCAQSIEAAKGPKITHKVYFDIKHGDENLGRSKSLEYLNDWVTLTFA